MSSSERDENRSVWLAGKPPDQATPALAADVEVDLAIVGGGFTGVSTAYHFKRRFPQKRVVLLEARTLGHGASGRNGGLLLNWINGAHPADAMGAKQIFDATQEGMAIVDGMIRDHGLAVPCARDGALEVITDERRWPAAVAEVERLAGVGVPLRALSRAELEGYIDVRGAAGAVLDPTAGRLDGIALLRGLAPVLAALGVEVHEQTPVARIVDGETVELTTPQARVRARAIVLATNAYTPRLGLFGDGVCAVHSLAIATEPRSPEDWAARGWRRGAGFSDDRDRLSYASMTLDGRLVFGGGSNAAYRYRFGNRPDLDRAADGAYEEIHAQLCRYLPGAADVPLAHRWSGPVALTLSRMCTMGVRGAHRNVYYALGYSGHGITLANLAGRVLTDLYAGEGERWRALPFYERRLGYIPPEPFRWLGYQLYTKLTGRSPRKDLA